MLCGETKEHTVLYQLVTLNTTVSFFSLSATGKRGRLPVQEEQKDNQLPHARAAHLHTLCFLDRRMPPTALLMFTSLDGCCVCLLASCHHQSDARVAHFSWVRPPS